MASLIQGVALFFLVFAGIGGLVDLYTAIGEAKIAGEKAASTIVCIAIVRLVFALAIALALLSGGNCV